MAKGKFHKWTEPEGLTLIQGWARNGLSKEQIAHNMGICRDTLNEWEKRFSDISDALKKGKEVVDLEVENALLKRALGYEYTEQRIEVSEKHGKKVIQITKHIAPDTTALIFWLKNRMPDKWRDKQQMEHSGGVGVNNPFEGLTTKELRKLAEEVQPPG